MDTGNKTSEQLEAELQKLQFAYNSLKTTYERHLQEHEALKASTEAEQRFSSIHVQQPDLFQAHSNYMALGRKAELALSENEISYRALFNHVTDAIYIQDEEGRFLDVNDGALKMYGYTRELLLGQSPLFLSAEGKNDLTVLDTMMKRAIAGEPQHFEFWGRRSDGEVFPKEVQLIKGIYFGQKVILAMARDITERKKAEETLRQSEEKYKSLVESTSDIIWETDMDGLYTYVSPQFENILGFTPGETLGRSPYDFIPGELVAGIGSGEKDAEDSTLPFYLLANKFRHHDGHPVYFETSGVPVRGLSGKLTGYRGVSRDVSKRHKAEKELHKLSLVVHQSPNTIIITDLNGKMEYINPAGCNFSGYEFDELIGKSPSIFGSGETPPETYKSLWNTIIAGNEWKGIFLNRKKSGEYFWESAFIVPLKDADGNTTHYLGVKEDISKRVQAEIALKESEERYRELFEASPDAIILADIKSGMLIDANTAACFLLGRSLEDILLLRHNALYPDRLELFSEEWFHGHATASKSKHNLQPAESILLRSDGSEIPVEVLANIITLKGRLTLQAVFRNITERKLAREELLKARDKAEAGDRLKSAFIQNISHELRTPLNGIIGFSEMIAEMDNSEEERAGFSKMIKRSSTRLINTITSYMDISMIISGITEINKRAFSLRPFMEKINDETVGICDSLNLNLHIIKKIPVEDQTIVTDEILLGKIFSYLIDNAIKFTNHGSITMAYERKGGFHHFSVSDTGTGISRNSLSVIFDVFTQADQSTSRGYEGSGLGLSIARGFVKLLGGEIWVHSQIGEGTTFFFTIPEKASILATPARVSTSTEPIQSEKLVILVAEDDDSNFKYLEIVLKKASFRVLRAINGFETVEFCQHHPEIRLLLTDLKMPGMNGFESTRQIRKILPELPIVALSGFISPTDETAALSAGCNEYMVKPVTRFKLLETINKLLQPVHN